MGDISENFSRAEFKCKCGCGFDTVDIDLVRLLEAIRAHFDRRITINSGCRCAPYNSSSRVNGSTSSQHLYGRAADIVVDRVDPALVYELADQMGIGGAGRYNSFTHVDTRTNGPARW
jgi:uncharacterized protein YcbK (DUF882 family)